MRGFFGHSCDTLLDAVGVAGFFRAATDTGERADTPKARVMTGHSSFLSDSTGLIETTDYGSSTTATSTTTTETGTRRKPGQVQLQQ